MPDKVVIVQQLAASARWGVAEVEWVGLRQCPDAGTVNAPHGKLEFEADRYRAVGGATVPESDSRTRPWVLCYRSGGRAAALAHSLKRTGFRSVTPVAGGVANSQAADLPSSTGA